MNIASKTSLLGFAKLCFLFTFYLNNKNIEIAYQFLFSLGRSSSVEET